MPNQVQTKNLFTATHLRERIIVSATLLFFLIAYSYWTWTSELNDLLGDSSYYILIARYFSPFSPENPVVSFFATQNSYPPLYPFVLATFGGATNLFIAHQLTALTFTLVFYLFYRWLKAEGLSWISALSATLLLAMIPGIYMEALYLRSEPIFLFFSLLGFAVYAQGENLTPLQKVAFTALCVACAMLTRTVGIAMLLAFSTTVIIRRVPFRWLGIIIAFMPPIIWRLSAGSGQQSYVDGLRARLEANHVDNILAVVPGMTRMLIDGWQTNIVGYGFNGAFAIAIGVACLLATIYRATKFQFDALYVLFTLLILVLWPYPAERVRFMMVLVPVMLGQLFIVSYHYYLHTVRLMEGRVIFSILLAMCFVAVAPSLVLSVQHSFELVPDDSGILRTNPTWFEMTPQVQRVASVQAQHRYLEVVSTLASSLPEGECVISVRPALVGLYANRIATIMPPLSANGEAMGLPIFPKCNFVLMSPAIPSYPEPLYPYRIWQDRIDITKEFYLNENDPNSEIIALLGRFKSQSQNATGMSK